MSRAVVNCQPVDNAYVMRLSGDLDLAATRTLDALVVTAAHLPPPFLVVLDLCGVGTFSAAGLRPIHTFITHCRTRGVQTYLVTAPGSIPHQFLRLAWQDEELTVVESIEQALAAAPCRGLDATTARPSGVRRNEKHDDPGAGPGRSGGIRRC